MKVLYCRISSIEQRLDRQRVNEKEYDLIVEDRCSGSIPFAEREGGRKVISLLNKGILKSISVLEIDRLGRNLRDVINTINFFSQSKITIYFISQGLQTLDDNYVENPIAKMMIAILATVGEMERNQIRERQLEGIKLAKIRGVYKGRSIGSKEDTFAFLTKHKKSFELLKKGYKAVEVSKITDVSLNTLTKIKKLAQINLS